MNDRSQRSANVLAMSQRRHRPDYMLLILPAMLVGIGLIVLFAISPALSSARDVAENYFINRQLIAVVLSIIAFVFAAHVPLSTWKQLERPLLISAGVASLAVRLFGERINGAYRWIQVGGFSFQAAELIKFALLIWLAGYLAARIRDGSIAKQETLKPVLIALGLIGFVVAVLQSDLGSAAVMTVMVGAMIFVAGVPMRRLLTIAAVVGIGVVLAISTSSYRRERLQTFLQPTRDCQAEGYQACQALIAVGSGGIFGLGLARSVQAYGYLPEAANDSIFAIFAEKFGFLGSGIFVGLFVVLFTRLKRVIEHIDDEYMRLIVVGVLAWLSTQSIINIGAMVGLLPLKGITLPFVSYGGTSLIFVAAAVGLAFSISRYTTFGARRSLKQEGSVYDDNSIGRRGERRSYHTTVSRRP